MSVTSIQWTDRTWNPVRGCTRVSEGCTRCYAETMAARNLPEMRSPATGKPFAVRTPGGPRWTGAVELIPSKLDEPLRWRKPQKVFVNSMSDLFHESLPDEAIDLVFAVMALVPRHTFQVLTKRPERMRRYLTESEDDGGRRARQRIGLEALSMVLDATEKLGCPPSFGAGITLGGEEGEEGDLTAWPLPNVWLGVSVEDQATADQRIPLLLQTPAAVRFISLEPQLAHVDLRPFLFRNEDPRFRCCPRCLYSTNRDETTCPNDGATLQREDVALDWVIQGGESGHGARPFDVAWARAARDQCRAAGVPFFLKQLGAKPFCEPTVPIPSDRSPLKDRKGGDESEWPEDLRGCRAFPQVSV